MPIAIFYLAIISFLVGVGSATFWEWSFFSVEWLVVLGILSVVGYARTAWQEKEKQKDNQKIKKEKDVELETKIKLQFSWLWLAVFFLALALGIARTEQFKAQLAVSPLASQIGEKVELQGIIIKMPEKRENSLVAVIAVEKELIQITTNRLATLAYGDEILVKGKLARPVSFETDYGRVFNYPGYLLAQGIKYQISFAEVEVIRVGQGNKIISTLLAFKEKFMAKLEERLPEPEVGLGEGLLLGVKQALGNDLEEAFRKTGLVHIVVLSGYNVMLVVAFFLFFLKSFSRFWQMIFGLVAITAFAFLVGLGATVVRACLMAGLLLIVNATGRIYFVMRALFLAGFLMVFFNPLTLVFDVGFQLSFLATLGLILIVPILEKYFQKAPNFLDWRSFLLATVATQIAVLPILLYQIGQLSLISIFANVVVLPMVPLAMLFTFLVGILSFVSDALATVFVYPAYWSLSYINNLTLYLADFKYAAVVVPSFGFYLVPISYALMAVLWWKFWQPKNDLEIKVENKTLIDFSLLEGFVIEEEIASEKIEMKKVEVKNKVMKIAKGSELEVVEKKEKNNKKTNIKKEPGDEPSSSLPIFFK